MKDVPSSVGIRFATIRRVYFAEGRDDEKRG